jgi:hypothetical protein
MCGQYQLQALKCNVSNVCMVTIRFCSSDRRFQHNDKLKEKIEMQEALSHENQGVQVVFHLSAC